MPWADGRLTALAIVCFPDKGDLDVLQQILAGGLSKMMEAGCTVVGGHTCAILKSSLATRSPARLIRNAC